MLDEIDILNWLDKEESVKPAIPAKSAYTNTLTSQEFSGISFEINREVLLSLLDKAIKVVPSRDMIPVLNNFQFRALNNKLEVVASSLDMAIVVSTNQISIKTEGVEVFPAQTFLTIVKETIAGNSVFVDVTATGAAITSGTFAAEIRLPSGSDYPAMDNLDNVVFHEIDRISFTKAIASVKYALPGKEYSGQDSLRMINVKGGKFTACDGSRFQQVRIEKFRLNMQLPTFSINTLLKVLTSTDQEHIEIGETAKRLVFKLNNTIFFINKMQDPYPNVEQLWLRPALSNDQELIVDKQELITAIKQVKFASDSSYHAIGLTLENKSMKVIAKDSNNKTAQATIPCVWAGKSRNIVVNYLHLAEMLKAYDKSECRFLLGEDTKTYRSPILLKDDDTMAIATISQMLAYRAGLA